MNDRYLFKAKRIDNGEWVKGYYAYYPNGFGSEVREDHIIRDAIKGIMYFIDPTTLCQCIGLKDKNGNLIWENDVVKCGRTMLVSWNEKFSSWCLTRKGWLYSHFFGESCEAGECEVVGNVIDNSELLEAEENEETD